MADNHNDGPDIPSWLITQTISVLLVFPICLLLLGVGFWKTSVITIIACAAMVLDFCRKFFVAVGGLILALVLLEWVGVDSNSVAAWVHHVFY
jgi:hypothetical protein